MVNAQDDPSFLESAIADPGSGFRENNRENRREEKDLH